MKNLSTNIDFTVFVLIFAVSSQREGGTALKSKGYFYARQNIGIAPPYINCNGLYSPHVGLDNGKGDAVFYCQKCQKIRTMKSKVQVSTTVDAKTAQDAVSSLLIYDTPENLLATANKLNGYFIAVAVLPDNFRSEVQSLCYAITDMLENLKQP